MHKDEIEAIKRLKKCCVLSQVADVLKILQSKIRFKIILETSDRDCTVGELAVLTNTTVQNISGHLKKMKKMNIVKASRRGAQVYYRCVDNRAAAFVKSLTSPEESSAPDVVPTVEVSAVA